MPSRWKGRLPSGAAARRRPATESQEAKFYISSSDRKRETVLTILYVRIDLAKCTGEKKPWDRAAREQLVCSQAPLFCRPANWLKHVEFCDGLCILR